MPTTPSHLLRRAGLLAVAALAACFDGTGPELAVEPSIRVSVEGTAFERMPLNVKSGKTTVYLETADIGKPPLLVIQGSGCGSVFTEVAPNTYAGTALQDVAEQLDAGRFRIIAVEKPGVAFGDEGQGASENCSADFRAAHSLDNWAAHLDQVMDALPGHLGGQQDWRVFGMSEGAVTASRLATLRSDITHLGYVSAHGCYHLGDMLVGMRRQWLANNPGADADDAQPMIDQVMASAEETLRQIAADPIDTQADIWGQTALFWSTFGQSCPARDLEGFGGDLLVAYGLSDPQVVAEGVDEIVARRIMARRPVETTRIVDGDHSLNRPADGQSYQNLVSVLRAFIEMREEPGVQ